MGEWGERCGDEKEKAEMGLFAQDKGCWEKTCTGVLTHGVECARKDERKLDITVRNSVLKLVNMR